MAFVKVRIPRTSQPQDLCGVDRSNWAGNRIIDGFVANSRVTHRGKPITATGPLFAAAYQAGVGLGGNADAGAGFTCDLSAHNGITIVCQYVQYSRSGSQVIFEHSANQTTNAGTFILYSDIAAGKLAFGTSAAGSYDSRTVPLPALGEVVTVVLRLRFTSSVDSADDVAIWINGVSPTSTSTTVTGAVRNFGNYTTYILGRGGSTLRAHATMGLYEVLAGFASDAECAELSASPWQIFEPEEQWIWVPDAAGAGVSSVYSDIATAFNVRGAAQIDLATSYNLRNSASQDITPAFSVRGAVPIDLSPSFNVRGLVQIDESTSYVIRGAVSADITPDYRIMPAGVVGSDLTPIYQVRGIAQGDVVAAYSLRGAVHGDCVLGYAIRGAVQSDVTASYAVAGSVGTVQRDLFVHYSVLGIAPAEMYAADVARELRRVWGAREVRRFWVARGEAFNF